MAYTTIDKPTDYFNTKLYTGNASTNNITGVGFQPDWVWIKNRSNTSSHNTFDAVRGGGKGLFTNATDAEETVANRLSAFNADGFTINGDTSNQTNSSGNNFVSWNWLGANGTASNSNGSITSTVSANTTAGFSIVSYSGASSGGSVGHGLGVKPDIVLIKCRSATANWLFTTDIIDGSKDYLFLNQTNAKGDLTTALPTSSVFTVSGDDDQGENGKTYIAYCFNSVKGYSKFGSYTGNGNADGTFVYTGFKPAWFMQKRTDVANGWHIFDTKRDTFNSCERYMTANATSSEPSGTDYVDILSNGFKIRRNGNDINASGGTYIYMAFAENPFVTSTGIPTTAR